MNRRPWLALAATWRGRAGGVQLHLDAERLLPQEDQGYLFASVQLPEAASLLSVPKR
jgi:multidrug efflux pump subunit AcrB